jgi:chromosome partitioning protein
MILVVGGEKGGSGKSCLAQNLAVFLKLKREQDVLLLDADPQGTTTDWVQERTATGRTPEIHSVQVSGNIRNTLLDLAKRYQTVVIDAGGQDSEALRSAMTVATHMLMPFRPKRRDLKTLEHAEELVKMAKAINPPLQVRAVITQCPSLPSQWQRVMDAKGVCQSYGIEPLEAVTYHRNVYDDTDEGGLSVLETDSDAKAQEEITAIAHELLGER